MWAIIFVAFISVVGSNSLQSECMAKEGEECQELAIKIYSPRSGYDFDETCRDMIQLGQCAIGALERCNEDEKSISASKKIFNYGEKICNPDNEIYKEFEDNSACIMAAFGKSGFCRSEEIMSESNSSQNYCKSSIVAVACQAFVITKECSEISKDAVLDLLTNTNVRLIRWCTEEEILESRKFIDLFIKSMNLSS